jgi:hypothetical protein
MFSLLPMSGRRLLNRRDLLRLGGTATAGLALPQTLPLLASSTTHRPTAKQCIFIFLCGGPSHIDMWDLKPDAPDAIRGPFKPISTGVPGLKIGDMLPNLSRHGDKFSIIRSMTHDSRNHGLGTAYTLLGDTLMPTRRAFPPTRTDHPGMGAILQSLSEESSKLPSWVVVPRAYTVPRKFFKGQSGGFLGPAYDPLFFNAEKVDSLAEKDFTVDGLNMPEGLNSRRLKGRNQLLANINASSKSLLETRATQNLQGYYDKAFSLMASEGIGSAFDLNQEPEKLKDRYGRHEYGQSFLMARRLVEAGVQMVNVFWTYYGKDGCQFNLWDSHGNTNEKACGGYNKGVDMIKGKYCCPAFDQAFPALLEDLSDRGILDDTLVVVTGEFGRSPKINKKAGRDHWPNCYSTVLAGGGIKGGRIYGASDRNGGYVKDSPVRPQDLSATILHAFGFSPGAEIHDPSGRPIHSSRGTPITALF